MLMGKHAAVGPLQRGGRMALDLFLPSRPDADLRAPPLRSKPRPRRDHRCAIGRRKNSGDARPDFARRGDVMGNTRTGRGLPATGELFPAAVRRPNCSQSQPKRTLVAMQQRHCDDSRLAFPPTAPHSDITPRDALLPDPRRQGSMSKNEAASVATRPTPRLPLGQASNDRGQYVSPKETRNVCKRKLLESRLLLGRGVAGHCTSRRADLDAFDRRLLALGDVRSPEPTRARSGLAFIPRVLSCLYPR